ncbi:hypothetical protein DBV15_09653 [Temnothorax longispinosus]|uniref:Uncharacterized protein n=1 Tax=Temnothorax longispinosus TaxID=300112 RepID=A0A4S2KAD1_9HYME|nr:hypothetical protein DBV15_09653 [Temnothorax longispinosus]
MCPIEEETRGDPSQTAVNRGIIVRRLIAFALTREGTAREPCRKIPLTRTCGIRSRTIFRLAISVWDLREKRGNEVPSHTFDDRHLQFNQL